jgi:cytochrome c553
VDAGRLHAPVRRLPRSHLPDQLPALSARGLLALPLLAAVALAAASATAPAAGVEAGRRKAEPCAACHGPDGNAAIPGVPSLSAMPAFYTHWQLLMYRDGRRTDPQMTPFVQHLTDADLADLSAFYAAQPARPRPAAVDEAKAVAGRALAQSQHCGSCHAPDLMGQNQVPRLAGQDFDYLMKRLRGYKARTTSDLDGMMTMVAQSLSDDDVEKLVHFMAAARPTTR